MAYAFIQDVPINLEIYQKLRAGLGELPAEGQLVHLVQVTDKGLRYIDVWESQEAWDRFVEERLHPAIGRIFAEIGFRPPAGEPPQQIIELIDIVH